MSSRDAALVAMEHLKGVPLVFGGVESQLELVEGPVIAEFKRLQALDRRRASLLRNEQKKKQEEKQQQQQQKQQEEEEEEKQQPTDPHEETSKSGDLTASRSAFPISMGRHRLFSESEGLENEDSAPPLKKGKKNAPSSSSPQDRLQGDGDELESGPGKGQQQEGGGGGGKSQKGKTRGKRSKKNRKGQE